MYLLAETGLPTFMAIGALMLTIGFLLFRSTRRLSRQAPDDPASFARALRPSNSPAVPRGHHLDAPEPLVRWEVEMHELAREMTAQLNSKMGALEHLIHEADRAADRLEAAVRGQRSEVRGQRSEIRDQRSEVKDQRSEVRGQRSDDKGQRTEDIEKKAGAQPLPSALCPLSSELPSAHSQAEKLRPADPADGASGHAVTSLGTGAEKLSPQRRYEEIYLLADYGYDAAGIAQRVGNPVGEVELILSLRDKR